MVAGAGGVPREIRDWRVLVLFSVLAAAAIFLPAWSEDGSGERASLDEHGDHHHDDSGEAVYDDYDEHAHHHEEYDENDVLAPPDYLAELVDPTTGEATGEVRAVLVHDGMHYLTPFNFRSAVVHMVGEMKKHLVVLLYRPESELCVELAEPWIAQAEALDAFMNASKHAGPALPLVVASFRVNAWADQDELDSHLEHGSGGDGATMIKEMGGEALLHDVPAVVVFAPDNTTATGIEMFLWTGHLTGRALAHYAAERAGWTHEQVARIDEDHGLEEAEHNPAGEFADGVLHVEEHHAEAHHGEEHHGEEHHGEEHHGEEHHGEEHHGEEHHGEEHHGEEHHLN